MKRVAAGALALVAAFVAVGNWEREARADEQSSGIRTVLAEVGALDSPELRGFRILKTFQCLVYERGRNDFALELCVDGDGRVVEAIDRRDGTAAVWSLRDDPTRSDVIVDRVEVNTLLSRMNVPDRYFSGPGHE
jgi:hypothetical protein